MARMIEHWRDIPGYEGLYQVSDQGNVKSLRRARLRMCPATGELAEYNYAEIILSAYISRGYMRVNLTIAGVIKHWSVHRLVALAFLDNPKGEKLVNHLDGNKRNNRIENLEWCGYSRNMQHAFDEGIRGKNQDHPRSKFTNAQIAEIRRRRRTTGLSTTKIAKEYGMSKTNAKDIVNGKTWKGVGE